MLTNVYIDGFNLYRGCLKEAPACRWLDPSQLAGSLVPRKSTLGEVKYFTARLKRKPDSARRQDIYIQALRAVGVTVDDTGTFMSHTVIRPLSTSPGRMSAVLEWHDKHSQTWMPLPNPKPGEWVRASVIDTEEKGTDVNLAAQLMWDALSGSMEEAIVISGDSDLQKPISMLADGGIIPVHVVNPTANSPSHELKVAATSYSTLNLGLLLVTQLPDPVVTSAGKTLRKPHRWR